jgi:hypothetical protein
MQEQRDRLVERLYEIYRGAPSTDCKAYRLAQQALQKLGDMTSLSAKRQVNLDRGMPAGIAAASQRRCLGGKTDRTDESAARLEVGCESVPYASKGEHAGPAEADGMLSLTKRLSARPPTGEPGTKVRRTGAQRGAQSDLPTADR